MPPFGRPQQITIEAGTRVRTATPPVEYTVLATPLTVWAIRVPCVEAWAFQWGALTWVVASQFARCHHAPVVLQYRDRDDHEWKERTCQSVQDAGRVAVQLKRHWAQVRVKP